MSCSPGRLEQRVRADDVGVQERARVVQRVVVVRLGGEVDHDVVARRPARRRARRRRCRPARSANRSAGQPVERRPVARVGELVQHGDVMVGVVQHVVDEVGADEAGAAGDEKSLHRSVDYRIGSRQLSDCGNGEDARMRGIILAGGTGSRLHPITLGSQQAAGPGLRQADDLLPAVDADLRRHPRHPGHHHPARAAGVPAAAGRRLAVRRLASPTRSSRRRTGWRRRSSSARSTSATSLLPWCWATTSSTATGLGTQLRRFERHRRRRGLRLLGGRSDRLRRGRVRRRRAGHLPGGEARAPEEPLRGARAVLLRQRRRRDRREPEAVGPRRARDHRRQPGLPGARRAAGRGPAPRHRLAGHRHVRLAERREQLRPHHREPAGPEDRLPRGGRLAAGLPVATSELAQRAAALAKSGYGDYLASLLLP